MFRRGVIVLAAACAALASTELRAQPPRRRAAGGDEQIKVEIKGRLNAEVFAIGGETTGVQITSGHVTWELDLGDSSELRSLAKQLHGKTAVATGELHVRQGVEIPRRWIVTVKSLRAADADREQKKDDGGAARAYLDENGKLRHALLLKDAQGGFAGFSGRLLTIEPDGAWRLQPFLNEKVREAEAEGKLSPKQLAELARSLERHDLLGLPEQSGKPVGANPHIVTLEFGKQQVKLTLPPGAPLPEQDPDAADKPEQRIAAVARLLRTLTEKKPE